MLFNTISYLLFLLSIVTVFWLMRPSDRMYLLLGASIVFYALWRVEFIVLIAFSAFVDYYFSLRIHDEQRDWLRKIWLLCSLTTNLSLLGYFKYTYFLVDNVRLMGGVLGSEWVFDPGPIVLPLGISFYTFLSISYTVDVYRKLFNPVRSFPVYLTYVMFWPHMIAGPILRAHELIPQVTGLNSLNRDWIGQGIRYILFGLFLKVALADQLAPLVDDAFLADPKKLSALDVWTMAFGFGFQIYFDFAGYSMIAIGSARLLGVHFPENFNWPYLASSPRDFWKRWHITLSSWIRDYLYLPLSGMRFRDESQGGLEIQVARTHSVRLTAALFVTWFLMGLWHGANWTFAFWGLWHATFIWLYRVTIPWLSQLPTAVRSIGGWAVTLAVAMLGWIPFRARSLSDTVTLLGRIVDYRAYTYLSFRENFYMVVALILVVMLLAYYAVGALRRSGRSMVLPLADIGAIAVAAFVVFIFLRPIGQFIYFQF